MSAQEIYKFVQLSTEKIVSSIKELLERKHLYQTIKIDLDSIAKSLEEQSTSITRDTLGPHLSKILTNPWSAHMPVT